MPGSGTSDIIIRPARPADARGLNDYISIIYHTARHMITRPDEFGGSTFSRRMWIGRKAANPLETCWIAVRPSGEIVGMVECWTDRRQRVAHSTCFAMSVHPKLHRQGLGSRLLCTLLDWVEHHNSLKRVELHVHSDNKGALALYLKHGFIEEGRRRAALFYEDGRIIDDILMACWPGGTAPDLCETPKADVRKNKRS